MAIIVRNTNYSGEVLEQLLTLAATSNEIVEKGLIMVIPGVEKKISLPRLKTGKMLQKRKENPGVDDSKGNFNYDEKSLDPVDFMAFTVFNPARSRTSGASGSRRATWYSRNFRPKLRTPFLASWPSRCSLNWATTM